MRSKLRATGMCLASGAGFVTRFRVSRAFLDRYAPQAAGGCAHLEYCNSRQGFAGIQRCDCWPDRGHRRVSANAGDGASLARISPWRCCPAPQWLPGQRRHSFSSPSCRIEICAAHHGLVAAGTRAPRPAQSLSRQAPGGCKFIFNSEVVTGRGAKAQGAGKGDRVAGRQLAAGASTTGAGQRKRGWHRLRSCINRR